ncbi:MAG TPA: hypothetical protein VF763_09715 [Candidatus Limnocylindrales bacterium]
MHRIEQSSAPSWAVEAGVADAWEQHVGLLVRGFQVSREQAAAALEAWYRRQRGRSPADPSYFRDFLPWYTHTRA